VYAVVVYEGRGDSGCHVFRGGVIANRNLPWPQVLDKPLMGKPVDSTATFSPFHHEAACLLKKPEDVISLVA
jgi:hypothetical protein